MCGRVHFSSLFPVAAHPNTRGHIQDTLCRVVAFSLSLSCLRLPPIWHRPTSIPPADNVSCDYIRCRFIAVTFSIPPLIRTFWNYYIYPTRTSINDLFASSAQFRRTLNRKCLLQLRLHPPLVLKREMSSFSYFCFFPSTAVSFSNGWKVEGKSSFLSVFHVQRFIRRP